MYLGIDLGTSSLKIVLLDSQLQIVAQTSHDLSVSRPKPLWSEQHPHDWWLALNKAMVTLQQQYANLLSEVVAMGLSGQQHGAVLLDKHGDVLRPAILWNDGRSMQECEHLMASVPDYAKITGNLIMPGFTAPKLAWVAEHEPEIFAKIDKVVLPKDYLRFKMSGVFATDMSDASGTSWLNVGKRQWSQTMLAATDLSLAQMPELFEGNAPTATVSAEIAKRWGLRDKVVIAGGAGDNAAAAISINVINPGDAFLSLGTSGTYFVADNKCSPNAAAGLHTFCHCLPNLWHQMNCHLSAASCLSWWASVCQEKNVELLMQEAEQHNYLQTHALFLPYLSGERSPHGNPYAQGVFFGMTHETKRADLTEAVLEGVAFNFAEGQKAMLASGTTIEQVAVVGGGARSLYWGKILATALQQELLYYKDREVGAAVGAARLAYLSVNTVKPCEAFVNPSIETTVQPDTEKLTEFQQKQLNFESLYQHLIPSFK
jgi:xylulokinase